MELKEKIEKLKKFEEYSLTETRDPLVILDWDGEAGDLFRKIHPELSVEYSNEHLLHIVELVNALSQYDLYRKKK